MTYLFGLTAKCGIPFLVLVDIFSIVFFLASCVAILTLLFVIPAAYSFARFNFPFKNGTLYLLLAVNMFTGPVLIIPLYKMFESFEFIKYLLCNDSAWSCFFDSYIHLVT